MLSKLFLTVLGALFLIPLQAAKSNKDSKTRQPNIIVVLVDDMGWGDLGCFYQKDRKGKEPAMTTPHLDKLAAEGIQLRRHYSGAPVCAPARASLFSGVHQGNARVVRDNTFDMPLENSHTLATVLKQAGYSTALIGKWGLGGGRESGGGPEESTAFPTKRGFDYFFGYLDHIAGHRHYPAEDPADSRSPDKINRIWDNGTVITKDCAKCYSTDLLTARAKKWIVDTRKASDKPFFLALTYIAPHASLQIPTQAYPKGGGLKGGLQWLGKPGELINTANGERDSYIESRYAKQKWPEFAKRHATMIARIDEGVGDIIHLLKDLKIDDNTLIVFLSDNGPHNEGSFLGIAQNPSFFRSYGPFDGIKRDTWEGGFRVPALVRWPAGIPAGGVTNTPGQFHDWMATFAELAGVPVPERCDGIYLLPTLTGKGEQKPGIVYTEYNYAGNTPNYKDFAPAHKKAPRGQMQMIMVDDYKGVRMQIKSQDDDFQIYDTIKDPQELNNLAGTAPKFDALQKKMKDKALTIRRPYDYYNQVRGCQAKRPYDSAPVPGVAVEGTRPGLLLSLDYPQALPWVPSAQSAPAQAKTRPVKGVSLPGSLKGDFTVSWQGYLDIPEDGDYTFHVSTDANDGSKAFIRLHDMPLVDADFAYKPGTEVDSSSAIATTECKAPTGKTPVHLKAGLHPVRIGYVHGNGPAKPSLKFEWTAPGKQQTVIPDSQFQYKE